MAFDLLVAGADDLSSLGFGERRGALEGGMAGCAPPLHLTPMTRDRTLAQDWFERFEGAGLDGVMAKAPAAAYQPGKRAMIKVKPKRTVDCVVAGLRWHKNGPGTMVGSLLLGLYDEQGRLHHVGVAASFRESYRRELVKELAPLRDGIDGHPWHGWIEAAGAASEGRPGRVPGGMSRWSQGKDQSWVPLRAERVVEVTYDHMQGSRFRHTAHLVRWRPDKGPARVHVRSARRHPAGGVEHDLRSVAETYGVAKAPGQGSAPVSTSWCSASSRYGLRPRAT